MNIAIKVFRNSLFCALLMLSLAACNNKKSGEDGSGTTTNNTQQNIQNSASCPNTGVVDATGKEAQPSSLKELYGRFFGGSFTFFINAGGGFRDYFFAAAGDIFLIGKGDFASPTQIGKAVILASPILTMKMVDRGGLQMIVGTFANLQICPVDPTAGAKAENCKVYDRMGGVSSVDVLGDNIYFTTVNGDFGSIGFDAVSSQSGCGRVLYSAAGNINSDTNTPNRAFRVAAGSDAVYFLTRNNSGDSALNINSVGNNIRDWTDSATLRALRRKTTLQRFAAGDAAPASVAVGDDKYHYLMDDLTAGTDGKIYASYWAPRVEDVESARKCSAIQPPPAICPDFTAATPLHVALAYFLNSKQGLLAVQGTDVKNYDADPVININAENGCSPDAYASGSPTCVRVPNLGFFFFNRLAANKDGVYLRGLFGYARLIGDSFEVTSGIPTGPETPRLEFPFEAGATDSFAGSLGIMLDPPETRIAEHVTFTGSNPMTVKAKGLGDIDGDDFRQNMLMAGGDHNAYVMADDTFRRINVLDVEDGNTFDVLQHAGTDFYPVGFPTVQTFSGKDRIISFNDMGSKYTIAFWNEDQQASIWHDAPPQSYGANQSPASMKPVLYLDDFLFHTLNDKDGPDDVHHVFVSAVDWSAPGLTQSPKKLENGGTQTMGFIGGEKIGDNYKVYLWVLQGIAVVTFPFNSATNAFEDPTELIIKVVGFKGVAAGGDQVYFVMEDGSVQVYKTDGSSVKTIPNAVALASGQKVSISLTPNYLNGKLIIPAMLSHTPPGAPSVVTAIVDLNNEANSKTLPVPFVLTATSGSKLYGASFSNGVEAFDFSKEPSEGFKGGTIDLGAGKAATPGEVGPSPSAPGNGNAAAAATGRMGGGGCSLQWIK